MKVVSPLINEDDDPKDRNSFKEISERHKDAKIERGIARMSLAMMAEQFDQDATKGVFRNPKKIINRLHYRLFELAATTGDPKVLLDCINFIHDRLDGKSPQAIHLGDADGEKLAINIVRFSDLPLVGESTTVASQPAKRLDS